MSWHIEVQTSGLFVLATAVGKPVLEGAFRADVPTHIRMRVLNQIAEAPAMESLLAVIRGDIRAIVSAMEADMGGGATGQAQARQAAPRLYEMIEQIDACLSAVSENNA